MRGWLGGVHALARPLVRVGTPPALVTLAGVALLVAAALLAPSRPALAGVLVAVGGVLDNLDGAVAVLRDRVSRSGALLDAVGDRIGDLACAAVLWGVGAPAWVVLVAVGLAQLQEYARARAGGLGLAEVGVVTVAERPVRLAIAAAFPIAVVIGPDLPWGLLGAGIWAGLGAVAVLQLGLTLGRRLRAEDAADRASARA